MRCGNSGDVEEHRVLTPGDLRLELQAMVVFSSIMVHARGQALAQ